MYWSTTDARKRCVYTCKIMECRPPVIEPDINSTVEHDDNRTIAHSPVPLTGNLLRACLRYILYMFLPYYILTRKSGSSWDLLSFKIDLDRICFMIVVPANLENWSQTELL